MTPADFLPSLESELHARGRPFDRAALESFVLSAWPLVDDDPDVTRWAGAFLEAHTPEVASWPSR